MPATYEPIATQTLGSAVASVTFSSISGAYTDLILVLEGKTSASDDLYLQFNADTGANYSNTTLRGNGTTASTTRGTGTSGIRLSDSSSPTTSSACLSVAQIQNYVNATTFKTVLARSNNASTGIDAIVSLWRSTSAINSIKIYCGGASNLATGGTFTLYGIKAA